MNERYDPILLLDYVEGELPDDARQRVEAMLAEDPKLAELVRGMQRDRAALRGAERAALPRDLVSGALAQVEREMLLDEDVAVPSPTVAAPVHRFRLAPLLTYGGIAAVLALTATVVFQTLQSEPAGHTEQAFAMSQDPAGVGLAEAPIKAQRQAAGADAAVASSDRFDAVDDEEAAMLSEALAAVELAVDPATTPSREYFAGFADADAAASPAAPAVVADLGARLGVHSDSPLALGDTFSVSAAPRFTVNVYTRSAEQTRQQLDDWAFSNRVVVSEPIAIPRAAQEGPTRGHASAPADELSAVAKRSVVAGDGLFESKGQRLDTPTADAARGRAEPTSQQVVLTLNQRQVGALLTELNRDVLRQNAFVLDKLAPTPAPELRQAAAEVASPAAETDALAGLGRRERAVVLDASEPGAIAEADAEAGVTELADGLGRATANETVPKSTTTARAPALRGAEATNNEPADTALLYFRQDPPDAFFGLPSADDAVPWRNWFGHSEPVLVEVVIEESPTPGVWPQAPSDASGTGAATPDTTD
ncbi:MAG: hypothetical protein AAF333_08415 [Planctomycetota bacterium]